MLEKKNKYIKVGMSKLIEDSTQLKSQFECCGANVCCPKWILDKCVKTNNDDCIRLINPNWESNVVEQCSGDNFSCLRKVNVVVHAGDDLKLNYGVVPTRSENSNYLYYGKLCVTNEGTDPANDVMITLQLFGVNGDQETLVDEKKILGQEGQPPVIIETSLNVPFACDVPYDQVSNFESLFVKSVVTWDGSKMTMSKCCLPIVPDQCEQDKACIVDEGPFSIDKDGNQKDLSDSISCEDAVVGNCAHFEYVINKDHLQNPNGDCQQKIYNRALLLRGECDDEVKLSENLKDECNFITHSNSCVCVTVRAPKFCADARAEKNIKYTPLIHCEKLIECEHTTIIPDPVRMENENNLLKKGGDNECSSCNDRAFYDCSPIKYTFTFDQEKKSFKIYYRWKAFWDHKCQGLIPAYDKKYWVKIFLEKLVNDQWDVVKMLQKDFNSSRLREGCLKGNAFEKNGCFDIEDDSLWDHDLRIRFKYMTHHGEYCLQENNLIDENKDRKNKKILQECIVPIELPVVSSSQRNFIFNSDNSDCNLNYEFVNGFTGFIEPGGSVFDFPGNEIIVSPPEDCCGDIIVSARLFADVSQNPDIERGQTFEISKSDIIRCPCFLKKNKDCKDQTFVKGVGARGKRFNEGEATGDVLYLGSGDLGVVANRNQGGFNFSSPGDYNLRFSYDGLSTLSFMVEGNGDQETLQFQLNNPPVDQSILQLFMSAQSDGTSTASALFDNALLELSDSSQYQIENISVISDTQRETVTQFFDIPASVDINNGFTLSGDLHLRGTFLSGGNERNRIDMQFGRCESVRPQRAHKTVKQPKKSPTKQTNQTSQHKFQQTKTTQQTNQQKNQQTKTTQQKNQQTSQKITQTQIPQKKYESSTTMKKTFKKSSITKNVVLGKK
jgi:hypothetical protein